MKSALAWRTCFSVCFLTGVMWAATPPDLRFRREHLPATTVEQVLTKYGLERNSAQGSSVGTINRVQYRFSAAPSGETLIVEREAVADPDPQKGTVARPRPEQGGRWFRENIPAPHGSQALSRGDFGNDGSDELLAGWPLQIFKRESSGRWVELNSNLKLPRSQRALAIDLNHDGLADIVSERGNAVTLLWNKTRLPWVRHVIASGFRNQTALPGDFGRPGQPDVISGDIENDHRLFLFSAPDWKPTLLISGIRVIQSAALDVDGDGDLDFIGAQYHPGLVFWLERPPRPLQDPWNYHLIDDSRQGGIDGVHGLALADMDGDSRSDLVAASGWTSGNFPDSIVWFRIPQDVRQAKSWQRFVLADRDAPGFNHYPSTGDVNGDGRGDVASSAKAGPRGNWFAWWEHPASRPTEPWKKHLISADQPGATNILIVDLSGDGEPDFLGSRGHGKGVVWFEAPNWTLHEIDNTLVGTHGLAAVDIDGDGDIDFATCAKDSGLLAWFENDGSGRFTEHRIHEDQSIYEIRLIDMNGDGTLDILVAAQESKNIVWYENRLRPHANALHWMLADSLVGA